MSEYEQKPVVDGRSSRVRYDRVLTHKEFSKKMLDLIHNLYDDRPEVLTSQLDYFTDDKLREIQDRHRFTKDSFEEA